MLDALKETFDEIAQLPEDEQKHIIEIIKEELASEKRWQELFDDPRSEVLLERMVAEALAEDTTRIQQHHTRRLEQLGYTVTLTPKEAA